MASAFLPPSSAPSSVFTIRPRSTSRASCTYAAPRIPVIAEPQHNVQFVDGDRPFLSDVECDLDMSNMSIGSPPSSPPLRSNELPAGSHFLLPPQTQRHTPSSPVPMDISPAPRRIASTMRVISPSERLASTKGLSGRALVQELFRGFGQDVANIASTNTNTVSGSFLRPPSTLKSARSSSPPHSPRGASMSKPNTARTRAALPSAWLQTTEHDPTPDTSATPGRTKVGRNRSQTMIDPRKTTEEPLSPTAAAAAGAAAPVAWDASISHDDMDIEMDIDADASVAHSVTAPSSPAGHVPSELNELFFQPSSPVLEASSPNRSALEPRSPEAEGFVEFDLEEEIAHAQQEELRRSGRAPSPEKGAIFSSSPPTSPSRPIRPGPGIGLGRPFERSATTGGQGSLFGSLAQAQAQQALPKRTLAPRRPVLSTIVPDGTGSLSAVPKTSVPPPTRRAFSACVTSSALVMGSPVMANLGSDDSQELDGSPARAYATRKAAPALRRDLLPTRAKVESKPTQSSPLTRLGLPGFGDNEADGKILPCHKVREDGLMRINCDTLDDLLAGHYDSQINSYTVIDCRFEYEYEGGHIPGAINLNTTQAIEEHLLGDNKPEPSRSGDGTKKDILVFHCEFSVKRAPTFAKHLRSRDRALNSHSYPKVHYPEVYVMEGGFSRYFKEKPSQVEPPFSYVQMDDPVHLRARHSDLNNFRKWERTKSYTYGEKQAAAAAIAQGQRSASSSSSSNRTSTTTSASSSTSSSISRRMDHAMGHAGSLSTLDEDGDSIADIDETSPCPPSAANYLRGGALGGKSRTFGRLALNRATSFGFATTKR